ncbi:ATP-binding protein [Pseudomonas sp. NPDC096950]|uniref:ATP-binding protein n=1 Tax=Pseudomonas sp. NPDC096950 TaxID=3364485 RepID=UPI00383A9505
MGSPEVRQFNVHPGIIKHLIKEQAGTFVKAVVELVMNSIDAGATRVDLIFLENGTFTVKDNGRGFADRREIEMFFETFGTPHSEGDARFGRFRIGRGQIMAYANTVWRSGNYKMDVRLLSEDAPLGYSLHETVEEQAGCHIDGVVTDESVLRELHYSGLMKTPWCRPANSDFARAIRYLDVPVYVDDEQLNTSPATCKWSFEDDYGYYLFDESSEFIVYNLGVYVASAKRRDFFVGGIFVSKKPIKLNMARNAWLNHGCKVIENLIKVTNREFRKSVAKSANMNDADLGALIYKVARQSEDIKEDEASILFDKRFILDLSGKRLSPREFLKNRVFSLYDGESSLIAERAVAEGAIAMLIPRMFHLAGMESSEAVAIDFMHALAGLFGEFTDGWNIRFVKFETIKASYSSITERVADADLTPEQFAALKALRHVAKDIAWSTKDPAKRTRRIFAGKSDCAEAWTNGFDYIEINVKVLQEACWSGISTLPALVLHEFCHQSASSLDEHEHGIEFYKRFHDVVLSENFASIVRACQMKYMSLLLEAGINICYSDRRIATKMKRIVLQSDVVKRRIELERKRRWAME